MTLSGRLAFAMVFLVSATTVALSLFTYHFVTESLIPRALDRLETKAALGATELEGALITARQDLLVIQNAVGVPQRVATRSISPIAPEADAQLRAGHCGAICGRTARKAGLASTKHYWSS